MSETLIEGIIEVPKNGTIPTGAKKTSFVSIAYQVPSDYGDYSYTDLISLDEAIKLRDELNALDL